MKREAGKEDPENIQNLVDSAQVIADIEIINLVETKIAFGQILNNNMIHTTYKNMLLENGMQPETNRADYKKYLKRLISENVPDAKFLKGYRANEPMNICRSRTESRAIDIECITNTETKTETHGEQLIVAVLGAMHTEKAAWTCVGQVEDGSGSSTIMAEAGVTTRWTPVHIRDMLTLPELHPEVNGHFQEGRFTINKRGKLFSNIGLDHGQEQNIKNFKHHGEPLPFTHLPDQLLLYLISGPEVTNHLTFFKDLISPNNNDSIYHHEQTKAYQSMFVEDTKLLYSKYKEYGNVFSDKTGSLYNLSTGLTLPSSTMYVVVILRSFFPMKTFLFHHRFRKMVICIIAANQI